MKTPGWLQMSKLSEELDRPSQTSPRFIPCLEPKINNVHQLYARILAFKNQIADKEVAVLTKPDLHCLPQQFFSSCFWGIPKRQLKH